MENIRQVSRKLILRRAIGKNQVFCRASLELLNKLTAALQGLGISAQEKNVLVLARNIVRIVMTCPKWVQGTNQLSLETRTFRNEVLRAWDPVKLIYETLPAIFETRDAEELTVKTVAALKELQGISGKMLTDFNSFLLKAIDASEDFEKLRGRAKAIKGLSGQLMLESFIAKLSVYEGTSEDVEGILGLASSKMRGHWTDTDIIRAKARISDWAMSFRHLEGLTYIDQNKPNRRMFGLIMAGSHGRNDLIVDVPAELPAEVEEAKNRISQILNSLPKQSAICALIEGGIETLKREE